MLTENVINSLKKIDGRIFHLFYYNLHSSILFDKDLSVPIIFGSKNIVMGKLKKMNELLNIDKSEKIKVYSYIISEQGYRKIDIYHGPIETVGKYIKRI